VFDFDCPSCKRRQLIFPTRITNLVNDDSGIVVFFTCWCGAPAAIRTGARAGTGTAPAPTTSQPRHALAS
jgi:hypothetical protein